MEIDILAELNKVNEESSIEDLPEVKVTKKAKKEEREEVVFPDPLAHEGDPLPPKNKHYHVKLNLGAGEMDIWAPNEKLARNTAFIRYRKNVVGLDFHTIDEVVKTITELKD